MKGRSRTSAGLVLFRLQDGILEFLLAHPGGPYWAKKDLGSWTIPKGEVEAGEDLLAAAIREFREETGVELDGPFLPLAPVRQAGGKTIHAFMVEGNCDAEAIRSNTFSLEWPPRSGKRAEFPEIDRAAFLPVQEAKAKLNVGQLPLLAQVVAILGAEGRIKA